MHAMISGAVNFLNSSNVKESIKSFNGGITFTLGIILLYDEVRHGVLYLKGKEIKKWSEEPINLERVVELVTKVSVIVSMIASRPGNQICSWAARLVATEEQLTSFFGPNLNYAQNPYHIRHRTNMASFILGIPGTLQILYKAYLYSRNAFKHDKIKKYHYLSKTKVQMMAGWNTVTHRTTIHGLNALAHCLIKAMK